MYIFSAGPRPEASDRASGTGRRRVTPMTAAAFYVSAGPYNYPPFYTYSSARTTARHVSACRAYRRTTQEIREETREKKMKNNELLKKKNTVRTYRTRFRQRDKTRHSFWERWGFSYFHESYGKKKRNRRRMGDGK